MGESRGASASLAILVPVLRDTAALATLLDRPRDTSVQWIVINGDARDPRLDPCREAHPDVCWLDSSAGRGQQLAMGMTRVTAEWVVILHADTRLGEGWRAELDRVAHESSCEWGCFRLRLDTTAWQARLIEMAVRLRVSLFRLPYGDQALFMRRELFDHLGGYADLPIMEDVDLVRRARRRGRLFRSPLCATTSARRWERDGWIRRTARHLALISLYFCGVRPDRLVRLDPARRTHPDPHGGRISL